MQCTNHLRQLVLGMHHYVGSRSELPPGYVSDSHSNPPSPHRDPHTWNAPPGWGWGAHLLDYLEEANLSLSLYLKEPVWFLEHADLIRTTIPTFLCPSSSGPVEPFVVVDGSNNPLDLGTGDVVLGRTHFVANHGQESCWGECGASATGPIFTDIYATGSESELRSTGAIVDVEINGDASRVADGPFYRNSDTRLKDVTDGLSKTIFLSEHSSMLSDKTWVGVVPGARTHPRIESPENGPDAAATLVLIHGGPSGGELDITGYPIIHPINFPTLHVGQAYAEHPGGGNVALGDGSVRFVSEEVELLLWAEYSSINEGETSREL